MSDPTAPEPTMEEILASIRRIISEDDAPAAADPVAAADAPPAGGGEPHEDVLELTQVAPEPPPITHAPEPAPVAAESVGDLDVFDAPEPAPPPPPRRAPPPPRAFEPEPEPASWSAAGHEADEDEPLIADHSADAAAGHFGALAQSLSMPAAGRSLEDVVRELLRPLLKEWLDANLTQIVETTVQSEVERISRRRVR
ncbi:pole-organizing protein PopZ [soil metagenome]